MQRTATSVYPLCGPEWINQRRVLGVHLLETSYWRSHFHSDCDCQGKCHLDINNPRVPTYDRASNMSSENEGVHGTIKELVPLVTYTHCSSHYLYPVVAGTLSLQQ